MSSNSDYEREERETDVKLTENNINIYSENISNNESKNKNLFNQHNGLGTKNNSKDFEFKNCDEMIQSYLYGANLNPKFKDDNNKSKNSNSKINKNNESNISNNISQNNNNKSEKNIDNNYIKSQNQIISSKNNQKIEINNGKTQLENDNFFGNNIVNNKTCLKPFGDTSYLNSVLQCLGNIDELKNHLLCNIDYFSADINIKQKPLSFVFCRLFKHLNENDVKLYDLESFRWILSYKNIAFKSEKRRNPIDLLVFLLDTLHDELNRVKYRKQNDNFDKSDRKSVIENGIIFFKNAYDSVISSNFNWFRISECLCKICYNKIYKLSTFNTYELDILKTSYITSRNLNISVNDCINSDLNSKKITCYCNYCNQKTEMEMHSSIYSSPNIFIFLINRNKFNSNDFDENLFNLNVRLDKIISLKGKIEKNNCPQVYELFGIVSLYKCKYVSFCQSSIDNCWYFYHEEIVEKVEEQKVEYYHQNNTFIPCILFYKKKDIN